MTVYLDGVMGLNFLVDWMLLLGVNRITGFPPGIRRAAAAAAMGGGYAGACLVPGLGFLRGGVWRVLSLGAMVVTAFGRGQGGLRRGILFVFLSMALSGLALGLGAAGPGAVGVCAGIVGLMCRLGFRGRAGARQFRQVRISHGGKSRSVMALEDTGNTLRDPVTGEPVIVADRELACTLLGLSRELLEHPEQVLETRPGEGFRLLPYQTVGSRGCFLLVLRCESVYVGKQKTGGLVAFAPVAFGNGEYHALTGG